MSTHGFFLFSLGADIGACLALLYAAIETWSTTELLGGALIGLSLLFLGSMIADVFAAVTGHGEG